MPNLAWYDESLHKAFVQRFAVSKVLYEQKTAHQHLIIFENPLYGRVLALDGVIQTTQRDEFIYHEMFVHVPALTHPEPKHVLIIGGGDGGVLRELVKYSRIESITMVEIDAEVIELSKKYLPEHSQGAFSDCRLEVIIEDAAQYIQRCQHKFDLILSDSTDPIGPGAALFAQSFYSNCMRCLQKDGILVTQNGVSLLQLDELVTTHRRMSDVFAKHGFYMAAVPTYTGGNMNYAWASNSLQINDISLDVLSDKYADLDLETKYYNPGVHVAAFALPTYVNQALQKQTIT